MEWCKFTKKNISCKKKTHFLVFALDLNIGAVKTSVNQLN